MGKEWFFLKNGLEVGPLDSQSLIDLAKKGRIETETPVKLGLDGRWYKAKDVDGLFKTEQTPPPETPRQEQFDDTETVSRSSVLDGPLVCPHCWQHFSHESLLYIAKHPELRGDPVLGDDAQQRFLPSRFTPKGHALDARGMESEDIACPRCHLEIPDTVIKLDSLYFSIVGAPSSGKSFFMTSMISRVRKILSKFFEYSFIDADPEFNFVINNHEQLLFANTNPDSFVTLIKTEQHGSLFSNQITLDRVITDLPKPIVYKIEPLPTHSSYQSSFKDLTKNIIFYDNAGEHFLPGQDSVTNPATKHLAQSDGLIFIFDPSIDADMRRRCVSDDPQLKDTSKIVNQSVLLSEMIARIRKNAGLKHGDRYAHPLIILVSKCDMWESLLCDKIRELTPWLFDKEKMQYYFDYETVANVSYHLRDIMLDIKPDIVSAAESFSDKVFFLPATALGKSAIMKDPAGPKSGAEHGISLKKTSNTTAAKSDRAYGIKPKEISPVWCETPFLLMLALGGYIPAASMLRTNPLEIEKFEFSKGYVKMIVPGCHDMLRLPSVYFGSTLYHPKLGKWFKVPDNREKQGADSQELDKTFWDK